VMLWVFVTNVVFPSTAAMPRIAIIAFIASIANIYLDVLI
jgi:hypothetical protein